MMNKNLPVVYKMEEEYCIPKTWEFTKPQNEAAGTDRMMELLWQNGPVVMQSPNNKPPKKTGEEVVFPAQKVIRFGGDLPQNLYVQEDEMASWLQIPLDYSSFDLLYSVHPPPTPLATVAPTRVTAEIYPAPPLLSPETPLVTQSMQNFMLFSKIPPEPPAEESTVVESNETPKVRPPDRPRISHSSVQLNVASAACTSATARELAGGTFEHTVTSSPGGSRASFSASGEAQQRPASVVAVDSKRKAVEENDDSQSQSEDIDFEAAEAKKQSGGSKSTKRSRAAEVHNLSERRRRDRINEKMRTLRELLPRCNKLDKASLLDEVIEYLKSLKMQVQMLAMGWSIMYPNMQQYMPPMGMGMNRPMVAYPSVMGPRFPMPPPSHMRQVPVADPSRAQPSNQTDKQPQMSNHVDLYQQLLNMQQTQLSQNQVAPQTDLKKASTSKNDPNKPSTSKNPRNLKNHDQKFG